MKIAQKNELDLAKALHEGLERDQFHILLQQKVETSQRRIAGAELLSRWYHPQLGRINPDVWVLMAESQGLMRNLTEWLVRKSLLCRHIVKDFDDNFHLSINVSPSVFDERFVDFMDDLYRQAGAPPKTLELEITETFKPRSLRALRDAVCYAQSKGFRVAIDDFGAGYSTMQYLVELPVNTVKLDKSIVQKAATMASAALVCKTLIGLAQDMGAQVVCEGVETEHHLETITNMGADFAQGYLFGQPMPMDIASLYLNKGSSNPRSLRECN